MIQLALRSLFNRSTIALLTVASIAFATALLVTVDRIREGTKESFSSTVSGVDLIVGPRAGSVQLLLASIFRIGEIPGAMDWESFETLSSRPEVRHMIPLSLGDSHAGFRVLGTDARYFEHYRYRDDSALSFAQGRPFEATEEVVLGAKVATELGYRLGDAIVLNHGLGRLALAEHDAHPFEVIGILSPTGTPVDATVHVSLEGIAALHETDHEEEEDHAHEGTPISAVLVSLESPLSTFAFQRTVNDFEAEALSAILPTMALLELWSVLEIGETALALVTVLMLISSLVGLIVTFLAMIAARRREMAILRVQGAGPRHILGLLVSEAAILGFCGAVLGILLGLALLAMLGPWIEAQYGLAPVFQGITLKDLGLVLLISLCAAIAGMIPAITAYTKSVSDGISVKL